MHEPANELGNKVHDHLGDHTVTVNHFVEDLTHQNDKHCTTICDMVETFNCDSSEIMKPHKCLAFEKLECDACKSNMYRNF